MAQVMLPRLRSQMRLSGVGGTPDLLSCCRGARTRAAVCLLVRPSRSIRVSSGSSRMVQAAAGYDQTTRSSSGSSSEAVQGGLRAHHPSTACQLPSQQGTSFGPHANKPKTAAAEPILADGLTLEEFYDNYMTPTAEKLYVKLHQKWYEMLYEKLCDHISYTGYLQDCRQDFQPLPPPSEPITVMKAGKLVDNLRGIINDRVQGPILYTITAQLPGADEKILLYLGQSGDGRKRILGYCQQGEGFFADKDDTMKKACLLFLAELGATIELQFVEVPAPLTPLGLEKEILKKVDFLLNKTHNGQVRELRLINLLVDTIVKLRKKAWKAAQISSKYQALDVDITEEERPNLKLRTLQTLQDSGQVAAELFKIWQEVMARLQQGPNGLQPVLDSGSHFVVAMADSPVQISPATINQYKVSELQAVYYRNTGRTPPRMSKPKLRQEVLDLLSGVAASSNNAAGFPDPINSVQDRRVSENSCSNDVLLTAPADTHPSRSTSSMTSAASVDSNTVSPTTGRRCRRASKARGSSAVVAISVSSSNNSQQQLTGSKNATSAGGEELSELLTPVLQGLVRVLCGPDAARSQKYLTQERCLVLLKSKLPKRDTEASLAAVAKDSFLNKITPGFLMTAAATRPILDACYYFSEGRVLTSKDMKIKQLRDLLLKKFKGKPSVLNFPLTEVVPSTPKGIKPSNCRRRSSQKAAIADKQLVPNRRRR